MKTNLALQGGGAHGAFTWGVADRILEEPEIEITAISGTSAGAMNAAAIKTGWIENGSEGARAKLRNYWERVTRYSPKIGYSRDLFSFAGPFAGIWHQNASMLGLAPSLDQLEQFWSPYQSNPFDFNLLRNIVEELFPLDALHSDKGPQLFVNATNVRSGKIKIFKHDEITPDALMASAALPSLFQAVEIGEEAYWDGGYTGNPALFPLIDETDCQDIIIVHINPIYRPKLPKTPLEIESRVNEISFNTPLLRELRQIDFIARWLDKNQLDNSRFKELRLHSIADDKLMNELSASSKIFASKMLIDELFEAGRAQADAFLLAHKSEIGKATTLNLREVFE